MWFCLSVLEAPSLWTTGGVRSWSEDPVGAPSSCAPPGWMARCAYLGGGVGPWCCHCGVPTPMEAHLSAVLQCGSLLHQVCCAHWRYFLVQKHPGLGGLSTLQMGDMGLFRWNMTSSPGRALIWLRPYFKGLTFSAMTVKPRRLKYPGL